MALIAATLGHVDPASADTITYVNDRFGTTLSFPVELFDRRDELPVNGDGARFRNDSGAEIAVWGQLNVLDYTPESYEKFLREAEPLDSTITYRASGKDWLMLSGLDAGTVFYQRHEFSAEQVIHSFEIRYPVSAKDRFDPLIGAIAASLDGP